MTSFRRATFAAVALVFRVFCFTPGVHAVAPDELDFTHLLGVDDAVSIILTMEINTRGGTKERVVEVFLTRDDRERRVLAQIVDPPFLNRTRFLSVERTNGRAARWLATSQGVRRIANSNSDERIFGSDFTAEDLSFLDTDEMSVTEDASTNATEQRFTIRTPDSDNVYRTVTIDSETGIVNSVVYHRAGEETKRYVVSEIGYSDGQPYPRVATMTTVADGTSTRIFIEQFDTRTPIPDRLFNRAALE